MAFLATCETKLSEDFILFHQLLQWRHDFFEYNISACPKLGSRHL